MKTALDQLSSDEFLSKFGSIGTAEGLYHALRGSAQIRELRNALASGAIEFEQIVDHVRALLSAFRPGVYFPADVSLGALAVLLAGVPGSQTDQFLERLAKLDFAEVPLAHRTARLVLEERKKTVVSNSFKPFLIATEIPAAGPLESRPVTIVTSGTSVENRAA